MPRPSDSGVGGENWTHGSTNTFPTPGVGFSGSQFSPTEFYQLCDSISTNIFTISSSGSNLEQALRVLGTSKGNIGLRDKLEVTQMSTNQVITQTTEDLKRLTVVVKRGDRKQKLQVEKLKNDFQQSVQRYSSLQKQVAFKLKSYLLPEHKPVQPELFYDDQDEATETQRLIEAEEKRHAQLRLQKEAEFEQGLIVETAQRIQRIEADIIDVNQIMKELGSMVHEQGDVIDSIEDHVESTHGNVESGREQLEKGAQYQSKYRKKLCILAAIVFVIGGIVAIVLVTQLSGSGSK